MKTLKHILIAWAGALCILSGCGGGQRQADSKSDNVITVRAIRMEPSANTQVRSYIGEVRSSRSIVLYAPYPGVLESMNVRVGDKVIDGALVAKINSESVRNSYDMSMATLRQAEDGYARIMKVRQGGGVPEVQVVEVETSLAKARSAAESAKHALAACDVKTPINGTVSEVFQFQGSEVSLAAPLARIVDEKSVEIIIPVPEAELKSVYVGGQAEVDIPALGLEDMPAKIIAKGVEADKLSHTYDCTLSLSSAVDALMPGMVCKVHLEGDAQCGYIVPAELVQTDRDGRYVWIVADGTVEKRKVTVSSFCGKGVVVSDGLNEGDMVISEGFQKVSTGMNVNVIQ